MTKRPEAITLREKVGRLFIVRPESLEPAIRYASDAELPPYRLQAVSGGMRERAREYPVGGILLYGHNILDASQLRTFIRDLRALPGTPLLSIDEEGGRVSRLAANPAFDVPRYESILKEYGFDIDFAPVADVNTNPDNIVIGTRAFSDDPGAAAPLVAAYVRGLAQTGVRGCLKHFPGHGDTRSDTHYDFASTAKGWEELLACELVPFRAGIEAGAPLVMAAHVAAPAVTGGNEPATLSRTLLTDKLRGELGFDGIIITDALEMGAITRRYGSGEAAVRALEAGADFLLCPLDYCAAFDAVVAAVGSGRITEARLDESLRRIASCFSA